MAWKCSISTYMTSTGGGCTNPAKHQEDGHWWCWGHLPSRAKAKREAKAAERRSAFDEQAAAARKRIDAYNLLERKTAAYNLIKAAMENSAPGKRLAAIESIISKEEG